MKQVAVLLSLLLAHCQSAPAGTAPQSDREQELQQKLVQAHLKILDLQLQAARLAAKPEEVLRILIEVGLGSEFPEVRTAAVRELEALAEEPRRAAVPAVLTRFAAGPVAFKIQALAFLSRVASPEAEAAVIGAAADASPAVRAATAAALKSAAREDAVQALLLLLRDRSREVQLAALDALGVRGRDSAVRPLLEFLSKQSDEQLLEKTADALGAIGSPAAVEALLSLLARTRRDTVRWSCINSLGKIGDPRAAEALRPYLAPAHPALVRTVTVESLGKLKDAAALPRLAQILRDESDPKLRAAAAAAAGRVGTAEVATSLLLPVYLEESSEDVRAALWDAMIGLAGDAIDSHRRLVEALLEKGRRADAEKLCARLHAAKAPAPLLRQYQDLENRVAGAAFEARDFNAALVHYRQLVALDPDRVEARTRVAYCFRELKDIDGAVRTLREIEPKLPRAEAAWWDNKLLILETLQLSRDPEPLIDEAHSLLAANPPVHPEGRRKILEQAVRQGASRLAHALSEREESPRKATLEALRRTGRKIILALADELESGAGVPKLLLEAGNTIAQTAFDPAVTEPARLKEAAAAWRAWHAQQR